MKDFDYGNRHAALLQECRQLIQQEWRVNIQNIYRESNQVADILAKKSMELNTGEKRIWIGPPEEVAAGMDQDKLGL